MAIDPRQLGPTQLCRLLNSTPLGEVISERQLHRHRTRAGFRIGDGRHVDLFRYIAWLVSQRHAPKPEPNGPTGYEAMKEQARARNALLSLSGRDIGELPAVANTERKARAAASFRFFCETYFPQTFHLNWSPDHLKVMAKIEIAVLEGGLFALAMPRGSGKTTIAECACLWAILFGHREFVALIGASEVHAEEMLDSIKMELDGNDLLLADFPEVVYPIQSLEGIANRCAGQLYQGERTHISWTAKEIVLPTVAGSKASGAIIKVAGITGRIRGMKYKRPDGRTVRPSLVVLDDPQSDESARSHSQCVHREALLAGAVLGLAGPGKKISGIMPCTVIRPDDMADRLLNRDLHPQWQGERTKMVYALPTNEKLWLQYAQVRSESLRQERGLADATEFYRQHQDEMDAGCVVAWPERFNPDELSAVQHAMNLKLQDEAAFMAEYQNEPLVADGPGADLVSAEQICVRLNRLERQHVPHGATRLTAFIDVHQNLLFWLVAAWDEDFTGAVIDYGAWPDPQRPWFTLRDATRTLSTASPGTGLEGAIYSGLERLAEQILGRAWRKDDGTSLFVERCLIDANWGHSTEVVYRFCHQSVHAAVLSPSHGRFVGASSRPFSEYERRDGERVGWNWRIPAASPDRPVRHVLFDANFWKSFLQARLAAAVGDRGSLVLYGDDPAKHRLLAEHLTAEYRVQTSGRGRVVDEWKVRPEHPDNHFLDCLVGCAVGASIQGASLIGEGGPEKKMATVRLSDLQKAAKRRWAQRAASGNR
ncbi:MAG: phage terminase large subunit family protein [Planctomycetaceae bacterium]|nr:phage terminase large subunit family protein [Planctomycetaceae bacterium]